MKFVFDRRGNEERFSILINFIEERVYCVQYKELVMLEIYLPLLPGTDTD